METEAKKKISRKKFLQVCGSVVAGGSLIGLSGVLLRQIIDPASQPDGSVSFYAGGASEGFISPYRLVSSFNVPDQVEAFELYDDKFVVATPNNIFLYGREGQLLNNFAVGSNLRDVAVHDRRIYLLFPSHIEVYDEDGNLIRDWAACSDESEYCSFAVTESGVFATDAALKNICKYTIEGTFVKFIQSPNRFIIPGKSFGIMCSDGVLYASNTGRHQVESYTLDGDYISSFGSAGAGAGRFCGCCNPVHLAHTSSGDIITSEKGSPRISCYGRDGKFHSLLLDTQSLGGGHRAYDVKVSGDKLFVGGRNVIAMYQYDPKPRAKTACVTCGVSGCALRERNMI
jgi:hypothetical protein